MPTPRSERFLETLELADQSGGVLAPIPADRSGCFTETDGLGFTETEDWDAGSGEIQSGSWENLVWMEGVGTRLPPLSSSSSVNLTYYRPVFYEYRGLG